MPTPSTVARGAPIGQYPRPGVVQVTARAVGCELSTAAQLLRPADPRSPFTRVVEIARALIAAGHGARVDQLCLPLDLARRGQPRPPLTPALWMDEAELDAREDEAQVAHLLDPKPSTWDTLRRVYVGYRRLLDDLIAAGDAAHGRPA